MEAWAWPGPGKQLETMTYQGEVNGTEAEMELCMCESGISPAGNDSQSCFVLFSNVLVNYLRLVLSDESDEKLGKWKSQSWDGIEQVSLRG